MTDPNPYASPVAECSSRRPAWPLLFHSVSCCFPATTSIVCHHSAELPHEIWVRVALSVLWVICGLLSFCRFLTVMRWNYSQRMVA